MSPARGRPRRCGPGSQQAIAIATLLLAAASQALANEPSKELTIRIYDYVSVDPSILKDASKEAAHLLRKPGIRVTCLDCEIWPEDRPEDHPCEAPLTATDIHLRLYDRAMADRIAARADCMGFSLISERFDSIGAVFYHRVASLKRKLGIPLGPILGAVIAYELAHLLFEDSHHSKAGLMRAHWDNKALIRISRNQLSFSPSESRLLGERLIQRAVADQRLASRHPAMGLYF